MAHSGVTVQDLFFYEYVCFVLSDFSYLFLELHLLCLGHELAAIEISNFLLPGVLNVICVHFLTLFLLILVETRARPFQLFEGQSDLVHVLL